MSSDENSENEEENQAVSSRFLLVLSIGFVIFFVGVVVMVLAVALGNGGSGSAGIVIFIGPFPIVFGAGPDAVWLILIGIVVAVISLVLFLLMRRKYG